jgi:hypothetical protein
MPGVGDAAGGAEPAEAQAAAKMPMGTSASPTA